jgi:hypothetical protein
MDVNHIYLKFYILQTSPLNHEKRKLKYFKSLLVKNYVYNYLKCRNYKHREQVTLVYGLAQLFLVEQLLPDLEQIM